MQKINFSPLSEFDSDKEDHLNGSWGIPLLPDEVDQNNSDVMIPLMPGPEVGLLEN